MLVRSSHVLHCAKDQAEERQFSREGLFIIMKRIRLWADVEWWLEVYTAAIEEYHISRPN